MKLVFVHWLDCPTGPGFVHFCSCICEGIVLFHSGIHHLSESVAACAGHMLPSETERDGKREREFNKSTGHDRLCYNINIEDSNVDVCLEAQI